MERVFVSSTFVDLEKHRDAVLKEILRLGATTVAMEQFGARDERPKEECLRIIREETDAFVGIYAHRYGSIPPGDELSITQQEYEEAFQRKVPTFVYLVDPSYRWSRKLVDEGPAAEKLRAFKQRLQRDRIYGRFTTPDSLAKGVIADLGRHFLGDDDTEVVRRGLIHSPPEGWISPARQSRRRYKVVVFDLDGTLLRGENFQFSWEAIWNWDQLGFGPRVQGELKREYMRRSAASSSAAERIAAYQDWCDKAVAMFRRRGLTRAQLKDLIDPVHLTRNCRAALTKLRQAGLAIAIVSGGIDTFLEDKFGDFRAYVDFAFINQLTFSGEGALEGVIATAYDFQGKVDALDLICAAVGCERSEAVFVGDQLNDDWVMLQADLAIAYTDRDVSARGTANVMVKEDDLLKIVPHILAEEA